MKDTRKRLSSTASTRKSLEAIRKGEAGLNEKRKKLLERVPKSNDWAAFEKDAISITDIAYLSAATEHEFALLRGKTRDILFHGEERHMLKVKEAREIGKQACIDKIGREFCKNMRTMLWFLIAKCVKL